MTSPVRRITGFLGMLEYRLIEAALLFLLALNGIGIYARYVMNQPIGELFEIMVLGGVTLYWLGAATAERVGGHLGMDFVVTHLPPNVRRITDFIRKAVIVSFLIIVAYSGVRLCMSQFRFGAHSGLIGMPVWIFSAFLPFSASLLAWRVVFPPRNVEPAHQVMV